MRKYKPRDDTPLGSAGSIEYAQLFPVGRSVCVVKIGSPEFTAWISGVDHFVYQVGDIFFSVKRYPRKRGTGYWTAYKQVNGVTEKFYIGNNDRLTTERLEEIGNELFYMIMRQGEV